MTLHVTTPPDIVTSDVVRQSTRDSCVGTFCCNQCRWSVCKHGFGSVKLQYFAVIAFLLERVCQIAPTNESGRCSHRTSTARASYAGVILSNWPLVTGCNSASVAENKRTSCSKSMWVHSSFTFY